MVLVVMVALDVMVALSMVLGVVVALVMVVTFGMVPVLVVALFVSVTCQHGSTSHAILVLGGVVKLGGNAPPNHLLVVQHLTANRK